jgi:hypothetical protein
MRAKPFSIVDLGGVRQFSSALPAPSSCSIQVKGYGKTALHASKRDQATIGLAIEL